MRRGARFIHIITFFATFPIRYALLVELSSAGITSSALAIFSLFRK
jgi:hypothetical protein